MATTLKKFSKFGILIQISLKFFPSAYIGQEVMIG